MRVLFYLLQKEFLQIFRNKTMLPVIFILPLVQMLVLVYAATFDVKTISVYVVDNDLSPTSRQMIDKIEGSSFFQVTGSSFSMSDAEKAILNDQADMVIKIPENFEKELIRDKHKEVQILVNAINSTKAELALNYASTVLREYNNHIITSMIGTSGSKQLSEIKIDESYWYNPELNYKFFMAPGILAVLVTVIGMFLSGMNLVREKEIGTIEQLNVTPIKKSQFIIGKLVPFLAIGLFDLAFGLTVARIAFHLPIVGNIGLLFSFAAVYLVGILGLGLLISTICETQQQTVFISFFFMLIFVMLGGIFTPVESMPDWAQIADRINPVYYFVRVMRMIVLKGSGFIDLKIEFGSLLTFGIVMLSLAIRRYKKVN